MYKEVSVQKRDKKQKRKEVKQSQNSEQSKKSSKNNKNKENMQVKNLLLLNEFKKPNLTVTRNDLASRNQMKRFNNAASLRNNNANQRKYHKLQQPTVTYNFQQY